MHWCLHWGLRSLARRCGGFPSHLSLNQHDQFTPLMFGLWVPFTSRFGFGSQRLWDGSRSPRQPVTPAHAPSPRLFGSPGAVGSAPGGPGDAGRHGGGSAGRARREKDARARLARARSRRAFCAHGGRAARWEFFFEDGSDIFPLFFSLVFWGLPFGLGGLFELAFEWYLPSRRVLVDRKGDLGNS